MVRRSVLIVAFVVVLLIPARGFGLDWSTVEVAPLTSSGLDTFISLALDGSDNPRIAYITYSGADSLRYAFCDSGCDVAANWSVATLDSALNDASSPFHQGFLALDAAGNPRIAYMDREAGVLYLKYTYCDSGCDNPANWTTVVVDQEPDGAFEASASASVTLDSLGNPRIGYNFTNAEKYAYCDAGCDTPSNWDTVVVMFNTEYVFLNLSLVLSPTDAHRGLFLVAVPGAQAVQYDHCESGCDSAANWSFATFGSAGYQQGFFPSPSVLDGAGNLAAAYSFGQLPDFEMFYKHCADAACSSSNSVNVETGQNLGDGLAFTTAGNPRITSVHASSDPAIKGLRYYTCDTDCFTATNWSFESVDHEGSINSLALTSTGYPRIAYQQVTDTTNQLLYAVGSEPAAPWAMAAEAEASSTLGEPGRPGSKAWTYACGLCLPFSLVLLWAWGRRREGWKR